MQIIMINKNMNG